MKILAVSDEVVDWIYSPALVKRCGEIDMVVSCGDLPIYYLEFILSTLNVPAVLVHGNHDSYEVGLHGVIKSEAAGWSDVDRQRIWVESKAGGVSVAGLQGCIRYRPQENYQYTQHEQFWRAIWLSRHMWLPYKKTGRGVDVLLTHAPPYGIQDGVDRAHIGFKAFNWLIRQFRPKLLLHGHQHRSYSARAATETLVGDTWVLNCHPWRVIDLELTQH